MCTKFEIASFSRCRNITRGPQILETTLAQGHDPIFFMWNFIMSLGKLQLQANCEVASFSRCRNIKGEPPLFLGVALWWALANPSCMPNLKSLASAVAEIFKGTLKFYGAFSSQGHAHFFSGWDFMMGLCKPELLAVFEVASFSRCRNIKGEPQNFRDLKV